jgi:hypothetical protein
MGLPIEIFGGLIIYTLFITLIAPMIVKLLPEGKSLAFIADAEIIDYSKK